jgi:hypothetical protein
MSNKVFEEAPQAPQPSGALDKVRKAARQLAYDTRYKVKSKFKEGQKTDPVSLKNAYLQQLNSSSAPGPVKALAKKMLLGEEYDVIDISEKTSLSTSIILNKVFSEASGDYVLRVKDPNAGTQYTRSYGNYAAAESKASQLRKKGLRVEITTSSSQKKNTYDKTGEKKNDGNLANNYPPYNKVTRGDVIAGATGKDQMGGKDKVRKESFIFEVEENKNKNEDKIDVMKGKNNIIINPNILENAAEYFYNQGYNEKDIAIISEGMGCDQFVEFVYDIGSTLLAEATAYQGELLTAKGQARKNPKVSSAKGASTPVSNTPSSGEKKKPEGKKTSPGQLSIDYNKKPTPPGQEKIKQALGSAVKKATSPEAKKAVGGAVIGAANTAARVALSAWKGHQAAMQKKKEGGSVAQQIGAGAGKALGSFLKKGTTHLKNSYEFTGWVDSLINEGYDIVDWTISELYDEFITEKSLSISQQQSAGAAYAAKMGEIDPSELKGASLEMYKTMTKKQLRDFAKTKHKGLPDKVEEQSNIQMTPQEIALQKKKAQIEAEIARRRKTQLTGISPMGRGDAKMINASYEVEKCECDDKKENEEDPRSMPTKVRNFKNKLRAMGLKMSYEPEGDVIDELTRFEKEKGEDFRTGKPSTPGGTWKNDPVMRHMNKVMGSERMGVQPRGKKKEPGKKPPAAGEVGSGVSSPAQKVQGRRAAIRRSQEFQSDTRGT